ncbi:MAG TPA: hypothetical protein EYQ18_06465 [Candidatus Handelsmanbacteria bacterium]|nr:hypothetical protein [Candidatus Handelsmanbacteria bacterium]
MQRLVAPRPRSISRACTTWGPVCSEAWPLGAAGWSWLSSTIFRRRRISTGRSTATGAATFGSRHSRGGISRCDGAHFYTFTTAEGLPANSNHDLLEDRHGNLWFSSKTRGIFCYDGTHFTSFTTEDGLADNDIRSIFEDRDGVLWIFTWDQGISRYDGERFTTYNKQNGLAGNKVTRIVEDRSGHLWFATQDGGASRYDGERFTTYNRQNGLTGNKISDILLDRDGDLWFATQDGGASRYDGEQFTSYHDTRGQLSYTACYGIYQDRQGRLWFSNPEVGPTYFDGERFQVLPVDYKPTHTFLEDQDGHLWFNTSNHGLAFYDGNQFTAFSTEDGLAHRQVQYILEDDQRFMWMSTWGGGLSRYDGKHWMHFTSESTPLPQDPTTDHRGLGTSRVEAVLADAQNNLWICTWGGGLFRDDGKTLKAFTRDDGFPDDSLWCAHIDRKEHIWFGTFKSGAVCYDGNTFKTYSTQDGLAHNSVWSICEDHHGQIWFGTQGGGVSRFDGENFKNYTTDDGLTSDFIWSILEDDEGQMWFSCSEFGVCRYDGQTFTNYTTEDGLAHDQVWYLFKDSHAHLWFGTWGGGISCFDGECFKNYTTDDGLADNNVRSIFEDRDGIYWFSTYGGGVCKFDGQVFQTIAKKDGLIHDAVQHVDQSRDGAIWIATEGGVSRYIPPTEPPTVRFVGVVADRRYNPDEEIAISAAQQLVTFEFQGASFTTAPDQLAYVYQLTGVDTDWQTSYQRRVEYRGLAPGNYAFRVKAVDRDLNYSSPIAVALVITPDMQQDRIDALEAELSQPQGLEQFIGQSPALKITLEQIHTVADTDVTVLVLGETGTGKGLAARAVHSLSARKEQPLIQLNCGAIPEGLVASELFGHEKGAFTGAVARKIGRFELADGGTLFLDEIGDLPLASQQVLLHVLQDGTFQRVGGDRTIAVDVRVVAAANRDLREGMRAGTFREDLYFRLSAFALHLSPLRERQDDIPLLLHYFIEESARHLNRPVPAISPEVLSYLLEYDWPGNVRELQHLAQHVVLVCRNDRVELQDVPVRDNTAGPQTTPPAPSTPPVLPAPTRATFPSLDEREKQLIAEALDTCNGIVYGDRGAASLLGIHPERLRAKMRKYDLKKTR